MSSMTDAGGRRTRRPSWSWSDRVRKVRRELGLTQSEFAALTGFGEKAIGAWESGKNTPDIATVCVTLEDKTGVEREWWLGWPERGLPDPDGPAVNSGWIRRELLLAPLAAVTRQYQRAA